MILNAKLWATQKMGNLKPGAAYSYRSHDGVVISKEVETGVESVVGWQYANNIAIGYELDTVWKDILIAAQTNKSLQTALDRVKIQYHLSKDHAK